MEAGTIIFLNMTMALSPMEKTEETTDRLTSAEMLIFFTEMDN